MDEAEWKFLQFPRSINENPKCQERVREDCVCRSSLCLVAMPTFKEGNVTEFIPGRLRLMGLVSTVLL